MRYPGLHKRIVAAVLALTGLVTFFSGPEFVSADLGQHNGSINHFIRSAQENDAQTQVTFPLHRGISNGQTVWYVITEASRRGTANSMGVNYAPKLEAAKGTPAVQAVAVASDGTITFPATVTFGLGRVVTPGCDLATTCKTNPTSAFPPAVAKYGAAGQNGYSPLIQLPDGSVLNAPQIANASGQADKVIALDTANGTVVYKETEGRYDHRVVHYVSFDASNPVAAALEDVTYAPTLNGAPQAGCSDPGSASQPCAREALIAFTNGQTTFPNPTPNPNRQGLDAAILDHQDPLNILEEIPEGQADPGHPAYSPLWDIHLASWTAAAVAAGQNVRQDDFATAFSNPLVVQPVQPAGFVVNCPAVSMNPSK
jgi:hypothetical protein